MWYGSIPPCSPAGTDTNTRGVNTESAIRDRRVWCDETVQGACPEGRRHAGCGDERVQDDQEQGRRRGHTTCHPRGQLLCQLRQFISLERQYRRRKGRLSFEARHNDVKVICFRCHSVHPFCCRNAVSAGSVFLFILYELDSAYFRDVFQGYE